MQDFNILFTSAGRRVSLIRSFRDALGCLGLRGKLVAADLQKSAPASFVADERELVPRVAAPDYLDRIRDICKRHQIHLVVPLIDTELRLLAPCRASFRAIGVELLVSSPEVTEICRDKRKTHAFFCMLEVDTPKLFSLEEIADEVSVGYPLLIKPADGSSSKGVTRITNARELEFFAEYVPNAIIQEFVSGQEYTLDVLVDFSGVVRCVVPRLRIETRAGEVSKGMTVKNQTLIAAGKRVAEALPGAVGCLTLQCFLRDDGGVTFIEINPRFGGGFPLSAEAGADFPRWIIEMVIGREPQIALDGWRDGVVMLRYDEPIFVMREMIS